MSYEIEININGLSSQALREKAAKIALSMCEKCKREKRCDLKSLDNENMFMQPTLNFYNRHIANIDLFADKCFGAATIECRHYEADL